MWGLHRDTADILAIGLPVFSLGAIPAGPLELLPRDAQALRSARVADVIHVAEGIRDTERRQAKQIRGGNTLRQQVEFASFLANRKRNGNLTFREHLRAVGGAIEE